MNTGNLNHRSQAEDSRNKAPGPVFDHERLDVYQMELQFIAWVTALIEEVQKSATAKTREVCDQLNRASLSALLNTAEGNGKRQRQVRAKFFDDARGSATESAACLDALVAKAMATTDRVQEGKQMLLRIVSMLCGLIDRFDAAVGAMHEEPVEYVLPSTNRLDSRTRTRTRRKRAI